ncbi:hypothetical protein [Neorhizobium alkalisoli]|uniref:Uncharacterized protein n=1 Tax=Neorhizobium alkalisoli TaxID=528178 RepID=A0A561QW34_9HYPH|nr:hypothetical protein [Neorhizobium alkalisoli]TWF54583.1 hypothetical protein FHW37_103453 [Neorhizobium alkalisoli]
MTMKKICFPACLAFIAASFLTAPLALADGDHYTAVSNTAMSVTGDVWMDDFSITFENDESLEFSDLVADHFRVNGKKIPASLYRVKDPADPELQNGNALCGAGDVTYLANWALDDGMTAIAVFTGNRPPKSDQDMCALYTYEDPK